MEGHAPHLDAWSIRPHCKTCKSNHHHRLPQREINHKRVQIPSHTLTTRRHPTLSLNLVLKPASFVTIAAFPSSFKLFNVIVARTAVPSLMSPHASRPSRDRRAQWMCVWATCSMSILPSNPTSTLQCLTAIANSHLSQITSSPYVLSINHHAMI